MWLAWEDVPNKITAGDRHDCQIFHVDQSRQRGALVTLLLGEDAWDADLSLELCCACPGEEEAPPKWPGALKGTTWRPPGRSLRFDTHFVNGDTKLE